MSIFYKLSNGSTHKTKTLFVRASDVNLKATKELDIANSRKLGKKVYAPVIKLETTNKLIGKHCNTVLLTFESEEQRDHKFADLEKQFNVVDIKNEE